MTDIIIYSFFALPAATFVGLWLYSAIYVKSVKSDAQILPQPEAQDVWLRTRPASRSRRRSQKPTFQATLDVAQFVDKLASQRESVSEADLATLETRLFDYWATPQNQDKTEIEGTGRPQLTDDELKQRRVR